MMPRDDGQSEWVTDSGRVELAANGLVVQGAVGWSSELPWHEYRGVRCPRGDTVEVNRAHDRPLVVTGVADAAGLAVAIAATAREAWDSGAVQAVCVARLLGLAPDGHLEIRPKAAPIEQNGCVGLGMLAVVLFIAAAALSVSAKSVFALVPLVLSLVTARSAVRCCQEPPTDDVPVADVRIDAHGLAWQSRLGSGQLAWQHLVRCECVEQTAANGPYWRLWLKTHHGPVAFDAPIDDRLAMTLVRVVEVNQAAPAADQALPAAPDTALSRARLPEAGSERGLSQLDA